MKKIVNYRALPMFLMFVIVGILMAIFLSAWAILPVVILAVIALFATLFIAKIRKYLLRVIMIIFALVISFISTNIDIYIQKDYMPIDEEKAVITGYIDGMSAFDESGIVKIGGDIVINKVSYTADDGHSGKVSGKLMLFGKLDKEVRVGDKVTISGKLFTLEFAPTSQEYLKNYRNGINVVMHANKLEGVEPGKLGFFNRIKIGTKANLNKYSSTTGVGNFIYSMMYGDKSGLDSQLKDNFAISGLSHLFAVSGLHVGMLALVLITILKKAKVNRWLQLLIMTIVLGAFNVLCCFSPSVLRATIMILVAQISLALGFKNDSISTLSFAGVLLLILRPMFLFDVSFLMTFFAVLGIVLLNKPIAKKFAFMPSYFAKPLSLSISVNIGIFPIVMYYFGSVSLLFMLANFIIIPIVTLAYPLIFIANIVTLILPFMGFTILPVSYLFQLVAIIGGGISKVPFFSVNIYMTVTFIVLWLAMLIFLSDYIIVGQKLKKVTATTMVILFSFMALSSAIGITKQKTTISTAYSDYYSDDGYYLLRHNGEDFLIINGQLSHGGVASVRYFMRRVGVSDIEVIIKSNMTSLDLDFIVANMADFGIDKFVMNSVDESYNNILNIELDTKVTDDNLYIYCPSPYSIGLTVNRVNVIFSKDSQFQHNDVLYDIVYSNNNVQKAIDYAPQYIITNNTQGILSLPPNLVNNDFTFELKNGKITIRSDDRWK